MDKTKSLEYQLGYYIGEFIVLKYLPTLSNDVFRTRKSVKISEEDLQEHDRLSGLWYKGYNKKGTEEDWNNLTSFRKKLEQKYLPKTLTCRVPMVTVKNIKDLKEGIKFSLRNCDVCSYKIETDEDIQIINDENLYFTIIKFELDNK